MILSRIDKMSSSGLLGIVQPMVKNFIKESMRSDGEHILERRTVKQILVGRPVDFIRRVQGYIDLAKSFGIRLGINLEKMSKIGYFRTTNNSVIGPLTIRTGKRNFASFLREYSHHNPNNFLLKLFDNNAENSQNLSSDKLERKFLEAFSDQGNRYYEEGNVGKCGLRRGTDGTAFNIYSIEQQRPLDLNTPFCRPMKLRFWNYSEPTSNNPELANYVFDKNVFNYASENWCFCSESKNQKLRKDALNRYGGKRSGRRKIRGTNEESDNKSGLNTQKCDGVYDYSQCQKNAAVYLSFPYFSNAPGLASYIDGWDGSDLMKTKNFISQTVPDSESEKRVQITGERKFEPQFSLHKLLGIPFKARVQLQFNVKITPSMTNGGRKRSMYLPFIWFEQRFDLADKIKEEIKMLDKIEPGFELFALILLISGVVLIIIAILTCHRKSKKKEIIDEDSWTDLYQKTRGKFDKLIPTQSQKSKYPGLKKNSQKNQIGSTSSLTQIIPKVKARDQNRNEMAGSSIKEKFGKNTKDKINLKMTVFTLKKIILSFLEIGFNNS